MDTFDAVSRTLRVSVAASMSLRVPEVIELAAAMLAWMAVACAAVASPETVTAMAETKTFVGASARLAALSTSV